MQILRWHTGLMVFLLFFYACDRDKHLTSKTVESVKVQLSFDMQQQDMLLIASTPYIPYLAQFQNHNALRSLASKGHLMCHVAYGWEDEGEEQQQRSYLNLPLYWKDDMSSLKAGHFIAETHSLIREGRYKIYHSMIFDTSDPDNYRILYISDDCISACWHRLQNIEEVIVQMPMHIAGMERKVPITYPLYARSPLRNL